MNATKPCSSLKSYKVDQACQYSYSLPDGPDPSTANFTQKYFPDSDGFKAQYFLTNPGEGVCVDYDECACELSSCEPHALCTNTNGSFTCTCKPGWNGTGTSLATRSSLCSDINECKTGQNNCHQNSSCFNTNGSFYCICQCGFSGNGTICVDADDGTICVDADECNPPL